MIAHIDRAGARVAPIGLAVAQAGPREPQKGTGPFHWSDVEIPGGRPPEPASCAIPEACHSLPKGLTNQGGQSPLEWSGAVGEHDSLGTVGQMLALPRPAPDMAPHPQVQCRE